MIIFFATTTDFVTSLNVSFDKSTYSSDEGDESVKAKIILSAESPDDITVHVKSEDDTATGEYR